MADLHRGSPEKRPRQPGRKEKFCAAAGIDDAACGYHSREIVLTDGNVVEDIISQARRHRCDLIVMGAHQGIITGTSVGATVKNVLRGSKLPVLVVPPAPEADAS